ncbi:hypothetical protein [Paenibacillus lutrae]|uniref:Uncharacterized protein n=1 Tax=Paenibacillus lutrae TaxID=2078573 RepID=A0A7X3K0N1_9BACL|nr:hypothetical protein [Paenibacillus lutrae]MVP01255.1 hypothetical protein [Paenibacillus lutrae]
MYFLILTLWLILLIAGIALVSSGSTAGIILIAAGLLILVMQMIYYRRRSGRIAASDYCGDIPVISFLDCDGTGKGGLDCDCCK